MKSQHILSNPAAKGGLRRTCCWEGPFGAVRLLERPSWLMAQPSTALRCAASSAFCMLKPMATQASPLTYLHGPLAGAETASLTCLRADSHPHKIDNLHVSACDCTSRHNILPIGCGVEGLAAAIRRQHVGSRQHAYCGRIQRAQRGGQDPMCTCAALQHARHHGRPRQR